MSHYSPESLYLIQKTREHNLEFPDKIPIKSQKIMKDFYSIFYESHSFLTGTSWLKDDLSKIHFAKIKDPKEIKIYSFDYIEESIGNHIISFSKYSIKFEFVNFLQDRKLSIIFFTNTN